MDIGEQLCLQCGLCCDGTLFGHVRLGSQDDAQKLKALGLPVTASRGRTTRVYFPQPCQALCADRRCRVYEDRPGQCRAFECRVFKDLRAGRIDFAAASRLVKHGRRCASRVRALLRNLGDTDEERSLDDRFDRMQERFEYGGMKLTEVHVFADLTQAVHKLNLLLHDMFHLRT